MLFSKELISIGGFGNYQQVKAFFVGMGKRGVWSDYINYLFEQKLISDFKVKMLDTRNEYWWYGDLLFVKYKRNKYNVKNGLFLEKFNTNIITKKRINNTLHNKNIQKFNMNGVDVYGCIDIEKYKFIKDPFSKYKADSKSICIFIKWMYNLDPYLLLLEILKTNNLGKFCKMCGDIITKRYTKTDFCVKCNKKIEIVSPQSMHLEKIEKDGILFYIKNNICPVCQIETNNVARHINRAHKIKFMDLVYYSLPNKFCECGKQLNRFNSMQEMVNFNNSLSEIFNDFDYYKDFNFYKFSCNKCANRNIFVKFKKVYRNEEILKKQKNTILEIQNNYHNIDGFKYIIDGLLNNLREMGHIELVEYKQHSYLAYSNYEKEWGKVFIDRWNVKNMKSNWEIPVVHPIFYEHENKTKLYVPDFYLELNGGRKIMIEIKSLWSFGYDFNKDEMKNPNLLLLNMHKFSNCYLHCYNNGVDFFIMVDNLEFNYKELLYEIKRRIRTRTRVSDQRKQTK